MESSEAKDGIVVQILVNCRDGHQLFAVHFWHSEGWTARNGLVGCVFSHTRETRHVHGYLPVMHTWRQRPSCKENDVMKEA